MRELGAEAARHFDVLIVREDSNLRARGPGEVAEIVMPTSAKVSPTYLYDGHKEPTLDRSGETHCDLR